MTAKKIAAGAVRSAHIKDGSLTGADISDGSITNADIAAGAGISDSKIGYATKTGRIQVPAIALSPQYSTVTSAKWAGLSNTSGGGAYFFAPVYLPNGAVITKLSYQAYDVDAVGHSNATLARVANGAAQDMASTGYSATTGGWQTLTAGSISNATVDTSAYAYFVYVYLSNGFNVAAGNIIIDFTYASPGY